MNGEGQYLVVRRAGGDGERVALEPARPITLGRSREAVVLTDASVSREHARVSYRTAPGGSRTWGARTGRR